LASCPFRSGLSWAIKVWGTIVWGTKVWAWVNPMRTDLFDFDLPPERIALRPISPRDAARLLVVRPGGVAEDRAVRDLPELLQPGDAVVVNDTRVIPARLVGRRIGRGEEPRIEATLHRRLDGSRWRAFVKPGRRLQPGCSQLGIQPSGDLGATGAPAATGWAGLVACDMP